MADVNGRWGRWEIVVPRPSKWEMGDGKIYGISHAGDGRRKIIICKIIFIANVYTVS
jgi:hypothetical protein